MMLPTPEAPKLKGRRTSGSAYSHTGDHVRNNSTGKDQWELEEEGVSHADSTPGNARGHQDRTTGWGKRIWD